MKHFKALDLEMQDNDKF